MKTQLSPTAAYIWYAIGIGVAVWGYFNQTVMMMGFAGFFCISVMLTILGEE